MDKKTKYSIKLAVPISTNQKAQVTLNMIPICSFIFAQNSNPIEY